MPVGKATIKRNGLPFECDFIKYQLAPHMQLLVLGIDDVITTHEYSIETDNRTTAEYGGRLDEHNGMIQGLLITQMKSDDWNFLRFRNPVIFILNLVA